MELFLDFYCVYKIKKRYQIYNCLLDLHNYTLKILIAKTKKILEKQVILNVYRWPSDGWF